MDDLLQLFNFCGAGNRDDESIFLAFDEAIEFISVPGGHCGVWRDMMVGVQSRSTGRAVQRWRVDKDAARARSRGRNLPSFRTATFAYLARLHANHGAHDSHTKQHAQT